MNGRTLLFSNPFSQYETKLPQNIIQSSLHQESPVATGFHCSHHCNHDNYPSTIPPENNAQKKKWKLTRNEMLGPPWFCSSHTPSSKVQMTDRCPTAHGRTYRLFNFILKKEKLKINWICALQVYTCKEGRCSFPSQTQHREVQQGKEGAREGKPMMPSLKINQKRGGGWPVTSMRNFNFCHFGFTAKRSSYS